MQVITLGSEHCRLAWITDLLTKCRALQSVMSF
jgi:hypothetical protein